MICLPLPERPTPLADGFVRDDDSTNEQEFFPSTMAERKAAIQPDRVVEDCTREPMMGSVAMELIDMVNPLRFTGYTGGNQLP